MGEASGLGFTFSEKDDPVTTIDPEIIAKCGMCGRNEDLENRLVCTALHDKYLKDGEQFFENSKLQYFEGSHFVHFQATETEETFSVPAERVKIPDTKKRNTKKVSIDLFSEKPKTFNVKKWKGKKEHVVVSKNLKRILKKRYGKKVSTGVTTPPAAKGAGASAFKVGDTPYRNDSLHRPSVGRIRSWRISGLPMP